jgi:hypothetical protein
LLGAQWQEFDLSKVTWTLPRGCADHSARFPDGGAAQHPAP